MTINRVLTLAGIMVLLVLGWRYVSTHPLQRKQPRIYVGDLVGGYAHSDWIKDFRAACPHMALVTDEKAADYSMKASWVPRERESRWVAFAERRDTAQVYIGESRDYIQILRDTCRLIRADLEDWTPPDVTFPPDKRTEAESPKAADRFDLRDVRNGNVVTSAIFDRQTGRVWVWTNIKGKNGNNESAFMAEDVYSYTRSPKPDPEMEVK